MDRVRWSTRHREERHAGNIRHRDDGDSEKREKDSGQSPKEWTANLVRVYFLEWNRSVTLAFIASHLRGQKEGA